MTGRKIIGGLAAYALGSIGAVILIADTTGSDTPIGLWAAGFLTILAGVLMARWGFMRMQPPAASFTPQLTVAPIPVVPSHTVAGLKLDVVLLYGRRGKRPERRVVTVHKVEIGRENTGKPVATMIEGYCHLRNAPRSFLVASIEEMADGATGEIVPHPSAWLLDHALPR